MTSNSASSAALLSLGIILFPSLSLLADQVNLGQHGFLSGQISGFSNGELILANPATSSPLRVDFAKVNDLTFDRDFSKMKQAASLVYLVNGDIYPCDKIEFDGKNFNLTLPAISKAVSVPASKVVGAILKISESRELLSPPQNLDGWERKIGGESWSVTPDRVITVNARGTSGKKIDLPSDFQFSTSIEFNPDTPPNMKLYLGGTESSIGRSSDRYILTFNNNSFEFHREQDARADRFIKLGPTLYADTERPSDSKTVKIDLIVRVSSSSKKVLVSTDGGINWTQFEDTAPHPITPKAIIINNNGSNFSLSGFKILSWQESLPVAALPDSSNESDVILTSDKDNISGKIIKLSTAGNSALVKTEFQDEPVKVPLELIQTVSFAIKAKPVKTGMPTIRFQGSGLLSGTPTQLKEGSLSVASELLGDVQVDSAFVTSVQGTQAPSQPEQSPESSKPGSASSTPESVKGNVIIR